MTQIFKPTFYLEGYGELGRLPDGAIINAGGVEGPNFTIGGVPVILVDGTASDGSGPVPILGVTGYEHNQTTADDTWTIIHNRNTRKIQVTIWNSLDEQIIANIVKIISPNEIQVKFGTALTGRAVLLMFS